LGFDVCGVGFLSSDYLCVEVVIVNERNMIASEQETVI
jgi:hypothetical protein